MAAIALGIALVLLSAGGVARADAGGATVVPVDATFRGQNDPPDRVDCISQRGTCEVYFNGTETFSGSWEGIDRYRAHGHFRDDGVFEFEGIHTFEGTVRGCGTGTFQFDEQGEASPLFNPMQGGFPVDAVWQLVPGSGTGDLGGLRSGSGAFSFATKVDQSFEGGRASGTMSCVPPRPMTR